MLYASVLKITIEIVTLWVVFYSLFVFLEGTRGLSVLKGMFFLIAMSFVSEVLKLVVIGWLLKKLLAIWLIAIVIIFQPELRRGLSRIGQFGLFSRKEKIIDEIVKAVDILSKKRTGALVAIEREVGLRHYIETGVLVDSRISSELITTIFAQNTALHDGGVVIKEGRLVAAGCLFPLSQDALLPKTLGTRHRAAIGLSEETDAVVIVVSEETQDISVAIGGKLNRGIERDTLVRILTTVYQNQKRPS